MQPCAQTTRSSSVWRSAILSQSPGSVSRIAGRRCRRMMWWPRIWREMHERGARDRQRRARSAGLPDRHAARSSGARSSRGSSTIWVSERGGEHDRAGVERVTAVRHACAHPSPRCSRCRARGSGNGTARRRRGSGPETMRSRWQRAAGEERGGAGRWRVRTSGAACQPVRIRQG